MARTRRRGSLPIVVFTLCVQRTLAWMPQVPFVPARQQESAAAATATAAAALTATTAVPGRTGRRQRGGKMRLSLSSSAFVRDHRIRIGSATTTGKRKRQRPEHKPLIAAAAAAAAGTAAAAEATERPEAAAAATEAAPAGGAQLTAKAVTTSQQNGEATVTITPATKASTKADTTAKAGGTVGGNKLQSVDFTTALMLSRELERTVVPARIENAYQLDAHNLAFGLRTLKGNLWLHVCWHPKGARCHVGATPPREKEQKAYTFSQTLRSLVRGLNIVGVGLARPLERVVRLDLAPRLDVPTTFRLYVEIMASRSNVVLVAVDSAGRETIATCAYQVSPSKSVRPLSTGQTYELPPPMAARRPTLEESFEDFVEGVGRVPTQPLKKALVGVYQGTSPVLVGVVASRVPGLTPATKVGDISPEQWRAMYSGPWRRWIEVVGDGGSPPPQATNGFPDAHDSVGDVGDVGGGGGGGGGVRSIGDSGGGSGSDDQSPSRGDARVDSASLSVSMTPWIAEDGASYYPTTLGEETAAAVAGVGVGVGAVTNVGAGSGAAADGSSAAAAALAVAGGVEGGVEGAGVGGGRRLFDSLGEMMETYYRGAQSNDEFDGLKRRCLTRVTATLAKLRERADEFEDQLAAAQEDKVSELNRRGDLLTTFGHTWTYGDTHVECEDFDTGDRVSIKISRDKTPIEAAQEAFRTGKKLKRSAGVVRELLDRANSQILYAEGIEMSLEQLSGGDPQTAFSREELSVLRGVAEELGLLGGADSVRKFATAFGVKQVQTGGAASGAGSGKRGGKNGKGQSGARRKGGGSKGGKKQAGKGGGGGGGSGGGRGAGGGSGKKGALTDGLLELRRAPGSPAVLVGRNNIQNERITFSLARAHELWLHARGVAGAHVLLRLEPGQDAEDDDLAFAADVAVYFSKARQSASTPVDYISPKMIKKMGGGGPGMVKFDGAKVVRGEPGRVEAAVAEAMRLREEGAR